MESPDSQPPKRGRKKSNEEDTPKRKPRRKSQPATLSEADKPIDPKIWLLLGVLLIAVGGFFFLDAAGAADVDTRNGGSFIQLVFSLVYSVLGRNLAFALFGGLGALSLIWGIVGWLKNRSPAVTPEQDQSGESLNE